MSFPTKTRAELQTLIDLLQQILDTLPLSTPQSNAVTDSLNEAMHELSTRNGGITITARVNLFSAMKETLIMAQAADPTVTPIDVFLVVANVIGVLNSNGSLQIDAINGVVTV